MNVQITDEGHCNPCCHWLQRIDAKLTTILELMQAGKATDLAIVVEPKGSETMSAHKKATGPALKHPCLAPKGGPAIRGGTKKAVMPGITLTDVPASITLQPIDANGNPVALTPADVVTGTVTSDSASFVVVAGADTQHYTATIPANTPLRTVANLAATLDGTIAGEPAALTSSVQLTLNIPPSPVAVDLQIILG